MKELTSVKNPETVMGQPVWWHHHGTKMQVNERKTYFKKSVLAIEGSAARLSIFRASLVSTDHGDWFIGYELSHSSQCKTIGRVYLDNDHLSAAFGLNDLSGEFGDSLIERYGADSAEQGTYIRWQNFLNIPCPGTGRDGDPNISLLLNDEIKGAVKKLLGL